MRCTNIFNDIYKIFFKKRCICYIKFWGEEVSTKACGLEDVFPDSFWFGSYDGRELCCM